MQSPVRPTAAGHLGKASSSPGDLAGDGCNRGDARNANARQSVWPSRNARSLECSLRSHLTFARRTEILPVAQPEDQIEARALATEIRRLAAVIWSKWPAAAGGARGRSRSRASTRRTGRGA